jgi:hypothetical protein
MSIFFACQGCGCRLRVGDGDAGKKTKCPACAAVTVAPVVSPVAATDERIAPLPTHADPQAGYDVFEVTPTCPLCHKVLPLGAVLCTGCGYHLNTGRKLRTVVADHVEFYWVPPIPYFLRMGICLGLLCVITAVALALGNWLVALNVALGAAVYLAFLLGTDATLKITQTSKGCVQIRKFWRIAFIPAFRRQTTLQRYDTLVIDTTNGLGLYGFVMGLGIALLLAPFGCVPAVVWLLWVMGRPKSHLLLESRRPREQFSLYHAWSDARMQEIVEAIQELSDLHIQRR